MLAFPLEKLGYKVDKNASNLRGQHALQAAPHFLGIPIVFNLPAVLIVAFITWILVRGIRESAGFNSAMVLLKIAIIGFFVAVGAFYVKPENWTPFAPNGIKGISSAAAIIFFAYIGFDAVSTAAEETRNPQRDMPIGILASLGICTVLYIAVAIVLTGMVKWNTLGNAEPLAIEALSGGRGDTRCKRKKPASARASSPEVREIRLRPRARPCFPRSGSLPTASCISKRCRRRAEE